ncbi:MAG: fatty acyl-AMP ligase [Myxococcales bacterium]|nr:fatty acyl-AMP ligase [Myxococcales bacterium]
MKPSAIPTLVDLVIQRAATARTAPMYTYLGERGSDEASITVDELQRQSQAIAVALRERMRPGDRALLIYGPGLEFITAFFGCLYAGVIAVPVFPPVRPREQKRVLAIARAATPTLVLTTQSILAQVSALSAALPELAALKWFATDAVSLDHAAQWQRPDIDADTLAFLQYTSGSTGAPKGVMVSHGNLLHNQRMIAAGFEHDESSVVVGWLPHFHDMGLIGNILQPLYIGSRGVLMSPAALIRDPMRWLRTISTTRAHTSGGPNFGYELCVVRKPKEEIDLDLSSWSLAFVGAEPIRPETLRRFAEAYAPYGFRPSAFYPCYGLAEATLIVTGAKKGQGASLVTSPEGREMVTSGAPLLTDEQTAWVVDPRTCQRCAGGEEGEIWVAGPSVALGYWQQQDETQRTFAAQVEGDPRKWLRTGDLGRQVAQGMVITGRIKDLLIIRGSNHYPQDLELTVERAHPAIRAGSVAAFSISVGGEERLAIAAEINRGKAEDGLLAVCDIVREAVAEEHDLRAHAIVLLAQSSIHKTSSGKIQRQSCRKAFLAGELEIQYASILGPVDGLVVKGQADVGSGPGEAADLRGWLRQEIAKAIGVEPLGWHPNLGGTRPPMWRRPFSWPDACCGK